MATTTASASSRISEQEYKRRIWAWTMYDWANSAFVTTVMAAVLPVYFSQVAGATLPSATVATTYWSTGLSLSLIIIAILAPILGTVSDVRLWSPQEPHLYTLQVALLADGQAMDERTVRVGFRTIEARGSRLLLNGEPIYLTGFNRHEDSPHRGMATDLETARKDLVDIKAAGANFVRLCHYPHHPGQPRETIPQATRCL